MQQVCYRKTISKVYFRPLKRPGLLLPFVLFSTFIYGQMQTFTSSGTFTVPAGVTIITVECWGAGGAGGGTTANNSRGGGGGAGGAYARKVLSVVPGTNYTVTVGGVTAGSTGAGATGSPSWFGTTGTVYAEGGAGGAAPNGGTVAGGTGSSASSIGDAVFAGGNGASGTSTLSGGGGGGAGSSGAGGNASGTTAGTGTASNGGNGGTGRTTEGNGNPGSNYGGGGSGAYLPDNTNHTGGNGAQGLVIVSWTVQQSFTSTTTFTVPAGVSSIIVECWGAGGAGGGNTTTSDGGGGGGGGAYSKSTLTVVPGTTYTVTVGTGGTGSTGNGTAGGDTWFNTAATILAKGGEGGLTPVAGAGGVGGTGGQAANSIGMVVYSGGNGGTGRNNNTGRGGPGGSSAGYTSDGTSGPVVWSTVTAAAAPAGGGIGGNGGNSGANGSPGSVPGGGGGGSGDGNRSGGTGANGKVVITWTPPVFYSQNSGDPALVANWLTTEGYPPNDFTSSSQTFSIQNNHVMTTTASGWTVSGTNSIVEILSGGILTEDFNASFSGNTTLFVKDGGTLNHNVNSVSIFGGGENFAATSTVNYGFAGAQTVNDASYGNLTLSGSGAKTITTSTVTGIMSMEGSATASASPTYGTDATLQYKGSAPQTTGVEFPATFSSTGGVIVDNSGGVTLDSDHTIDYTLAFVSGKLTTGANTLTMGLNGSISGAGTGKYINGNLRINIDVGTVTEIFEIGDATTYAPVTIDFAGSTNGTGNILAYTTSGDHPNIGTSAINPFASVNRYWTLTNSGVTGFTSYSGTFGFAATDLDGGTDYNYLAAGYYNAAVWSYPSVGTLTATSTQVTGLTTFGDFQLGQLLSNYRSAASGNWGQAATWEVFAGGSWIPAPVPPNAANGDVIIRTPNTITLAGSVSADQLTVDAGATLLLNADMTVSDGTGTDITINGTLNTGGNYIMSGTGSLSLGSGASILIGSPDGITSSGATGNIQTASRAFSQDANYTYNGTSSQVTGSGLPSTVNDLTINNSSGVTLSSQVIIKGTLSLTDGEFSTGATILTFHTSDLPISRTSGTITTNSSGSISFGTAGNTGGAAFAIPSGTFTSPPVITDFTINRTNSLTIGDQLISVKGIVLCNGPLITNSNLLLVSDASGTALVDGSGTGSITGNVTMQRYLASGFGYKYFSSPFQAATVGEFGDDMDLMASFPSFYRYDENRTSSGWVSYTTAANVLSQMQGYSVQFGAAAVPNTADVTGSVTNGAVSVTLYNHNYTYTKGFNLVGNPYPSPIDWDAASGWTKTNIDNALYYFKASATDQYGGTYSTYINGVSSDGQATSVIPSMQGFFVHVTDGAYPVTGTLAADNNVRIKNLTHPFLKSGNTKSLQLLRLSAEFSDDPGSVDPAVIYFDENAKLLMDPLLDALKLMNTDLKVPNVYSLLPDGSKLSINAIPQVAGPYLQVPLGLKANRAGTVVFRLPAVDETTSLMGVSLYDAVTGTTQDMLNGNTYSVLLAKAEYLNRFYLNIGSVTTGVDEPQTEKPSVMFYSSKGILHAELGGLMEGRVTLTLYNLTGQPVHIEELPVPGNYELTPSLKDGIYICSVISGNNRYQKKVFFRNE
jgi:hypothetical protein